MGPFLRTLRPDTARLRRVFDRHAHMVGDPHRTEPLMRAIKRTVHTGDVVVDVGAGTGILALAACQAGAKRVYAIDVDGEALELAAWYAKRLGCEGRIVFLEGLSHAVQLDEKVDVLIAEIVGQLGFEENILVSLKDAKRRWLKRGGIIIPERIELWGAPRTRGTLLSSPQRLADVSFRKTFPTTLHLHPTFTVKRDGVLRGLAAWPRVTWTHGCITDAAPSKPKTHWGQGLLDITPTRVRRGERTRWEIVMRPDPKNPLVETEVLWRRCP
ncbi:MAG: 50S ribosomal protein L11 methyltransferase [Deltaproteobacteria bacterium]|nr:50S ribosomal protein L11 methyltransferase [Deltaproteobacteria bacterium]